MYVAYQAIRRCRHDRMTGRMTPQERALEPSFMPPGGGSELNGALGLMLGL